MPLSILCFASYFKGVAFMRAAKQAGCRVFLLTVSKLYDHPDWPRESLDDIYHIPDMYDQRALNVAVSYLMQKQWIDRIVALDDFDVEYAAGAREHLRMPGIGSSTVRFFRDKLAMRTQAQRRGLRVPAFTGVFNKAQCEAFMQATPEPWLLKPRSEASATGIRKIEHPGQLWGELDKLGDKRIYHLLEQFVPGDIFHVDSLTVNGEVIFAEAHGYSAPPMAVMHEGGLFSTRTLPRESDDARALIAFNRDLLRAFGLQQGASHTEFIKAKTDGQLYFLETSARVGGANIAELVEFATGVNLWAEWARVEVAAARGEAYQLPPLRQDYAGILITLAKQEKPDLSAYNDPEVVWRLNEPNHAGLIVRADNPARVQTLLDAYHPRFHHDFHTRLPVPDKPTH
jgi:hypothetical protein